MGAASRTVADIVRTGVAVIGAGRPGGGQTVVGGLVAGIIAIGSAAAGITGMNGAASSAAGVTAVAVQTVITRGGVVGMDTAGCGIAAVAGADIAVITVETACPCARSIGTYVADGAEIVVITKLIAAIGVSAIAGTVSIVIDAVGTFFRPAGYPGNFRGFLTLITRDIKCGHGYIIRCALV